MVESRDSRDDTSSRAGSAYDRSGRKMQKTFHMPADDKYHCNPQSFREYQEKPEHANAGSKKYYGKEYNYVRSEEYPHMPYGMSPTDRSPRMSPQHSHSHKENTTGSVSTTPSMGNISETGMYAQPYIGKHSRSNSISDISLLSLGQEVERDKTMGFHSPRSEIGSIHAHGQNAASTPLNINSLRFFRKDEDSGDSCDDEQMDKGKGRKKIKMEFIKDKGRRGVTFSKRKKGIMKKAYELNVLTKCEILLVVASETGHVYTFATPKLQPIIKQHENLIQQYLNTPYMNKVNRIYDPADRYNEPDSYYKGADGYGYDRILRQEYPSYYHSGYDTDSSPGNMNNGRHQ